MRRNSICLNLVETKSKSLVLSEVSLENCVTSIPVPVRQTWREPLLPMFFGLTDKYSLMSYAKQWWEMHWTGAVVVGCQEVTIYCEKENTSSSSSYKKGKYVLLQATVIVTFMVDFLMTMGWKRKGPRIDPCRTLQSRNGEKIFVASVKNC